MTTDMRQTLVRLEPEQHELLRKYAESTDKSVSQVIRDMLEAHRDSMIDVIEQKEKERQMKRRISFGFSDRAQERMR